jgi:hypothetical protein
MASDAVDFMELGSQGVANSVWGCVKLGVKREEALMAKALDWLAANSSAAKMQVRVCVCGGVLAGGVEQAFCRPQGRPLSQNNVWDLAVCLKPDP